MDRIKVLAVAPYPGLATLIEGVAPDYPDLDITVELGDLESGLAVAHTAFSEAFDIVVSRGGTAQMLEEELSLPVVEIELSTGDIVRQTRTLPAEGPRLAAVGFGNTFRKLTGVADLLPRPIDVVSVDFADEVPLAIERLRASGHETFLCDNVAFVTAKGMGLDARLLVSGPESVRIALDRAAFYVTQWREGAERNRLLWKIIQHQPGYFVLCSEVGRLIYSGVPAEQGWLVTEIFQRFDERSERVVLHRSHRIWRIRRSDFESGGRSYVTYSITSSREPVQGGMAGIEYLSQSQVAQELAESVFRAAGAEPFVKRDVELAIASGRPVMLRGEIGCGKDQIVKMLYLASGRTAHPYVTIDCSLLSDLSREFLLDSYNSPLYEADQTIVIRALHALDEDSWHELLATARQTRLTERNLVLLSGNDDEDGGEPYVLTAFAEQLRCHTLTVAPLRARPDGVEAAVTSYLAHAAAAAGREAPGIEPGAMEELSAYPWPRNYLELRRVLDNLLAATPSGDITADAVREALGRGQASRFSSTSTPSEASTLDLLRPLEEIERDIARLVLKSEQGNRTRAAEVLGISRTTMWRLLKE